MAALGDSTEVEVSSDGKQVRRKNNLKLPELAKRAEKKRDAKA